MAGRWSDASAFRADSSAAPAAQPSRRQLIALLAVLALAAGAIAIASYLVRPEKARSFDLFHGSLFLSDQNSPVAIDLATGKPTLRLLGANAQVGITGTQQLGIVPLQDHTLLLNEATGEFNMVDNSGFVVKRDGGGVPLAKRSTTSTSFGVASDDGQAYIVRTGATGGTDVYLVSQPTVESAISASKSVRPRASASMPLPAAGPPGGAVGADGDLWLLVGGTGNGGHRTIRQLSVPAGSSAGVALDSADRGTVDGPAAVGTATTNADGGGANVVAVASGSRIQVFGAGASPQTESYPAVAGVDEILPVTGGQGRLAFLMHGGAGWSIVSVNADGSGLKAPKPISGLPAGAQLVSPAASGGQLYTIDQLDGHTYRIGYDATSVSAPAYPLAQSGSHTAETSDFANAYVIARGPRIVFNSATHANALMLFTDGSHPPLTIAKSAAVSVNAATGADALTKVTANPNAGSGKSAGKGKTPPKGQQKGVAPVNPRIDCTHAVQKPHVPVITGTTPGSRSVALSWSYPLFDPQDCYPSTYLVTATLISNDAPPAPASVTVQSQTGTNLIGLFPSTRYKITVTAYINKQGTESAPVTVNTGPEGPAAPTGLRVSSDNTGNWTIDWNSCGSVEQGCVPAQSWTVTPSFCDGRGVASPPTPLTETADPTSRVQPTATYKGGDDLLGRGLQFQVQGTGDEGQAGTPSAKSGCVFSWAPPDASAMTLSASQPDNTTLSGTTTTRASVDLGADPVRAVGGVGAKIAFTLDGPGGARTQNVTYTGSGAIVTASFDGLQPGEQYSVTARVSAPRHDASAVTLGPTPVLAAADYPADMSLDSQCVTGGGLIQLTCDFSAQIHGLTSADAHGERFDIVDTENEQSQIRCGNTTRSLDEQGIDPADPVSIPNLLLLLYRGDCDATIVLRESGGIAAPVFGNAVKVLHATFTVGNPTTYNAQAGDFSAAWDPTVTDSEALVKYQGTTFSDAQIAQLTDTWQVSVLGPGGQPCGSRAAQPTSAGIDVPASADCVRQFGGQSGWSVVITYNDAGTSNQHQVPGAHDISGPPPSFQPCGPTGFAAGWGAALADGVTVNYGGDQAQLAGCSAFTYTLKDGDGNVCDTMSDVDPRTPITLQVQPTCPPPDQKWTVGISWHNDDTGAQEQFPDIALGKPPPS